MHRLSFSGNEASGGMCSKCARDTSDDSDAAQLPSPASTTTVSTPPPSPESMSRTQPAAAAAASTPPTAVAHTPSALSLASAAAVPSQSPATNASAAAAAASSLSPRPKSAIQKKKNRCFSKGCRKSHVCHPSPLTPPVAVAACRPLINYAHALPSHSIDRRVHADMRAHRSNNDDLATRHQTFHGGAADEQVHLRLHVLREAPTPRQAPYSTHIDLLNPPPFWKRA